MARIDTLENFLTDVATSIRTKTGKTDAITPANFDTEIANIETDPNLQSKTITPTKSSQTVVPDTGFDGLSSVTVNAIPSTYIAPSGTKTITANGTHDVTSYANAEITVESVMKIAPRGTTVYNLLQGNTATYIELNLYFTNTSNCTNFSSMFYACNNLKGFRNWSKLSTTSATTMAGMFGECSKLETVDVSGFDTSKVTSMQSMFAYCYSLKEIDISNFDTSVLKDTSYMFNNCSALERLIINNSTVFPMTATSMLSSVPGNVYVPDNLVDTYKSATNWSTYADKIKGMSELT